MMFCGSMEHFAWMYCQNSSNYTQQITRYSIWVIPQFSWTGWRTIIPDHLDIVYLRFKNTFLCFISANNSREQVNFFLSQRNVSTANRPATCSSHQCVSPTEMKTELGDHNHRTWFWSPNPASASLHFHVGKIHTSGHCRAYSKF